MLYAPPLTGPLVWFVALSAVLVGTGLRLDLGTGPSAPGFERLGPADRYDPDRGVGWIGAATPRAVSGDAEEPIHRSAVTGDGPFWLSADVPEGPHRVTVTLGDPTDATRTTVTAESRRLLGERLATAPGEFERVTWTVDVRTSALPDGGTVELTHREVGSLTWDDRLTLGFADERPSVAAVEVEPAPDATTVFLAGDSTVTDQARSPWNSWGQMLTRFVGPDVAVANHAESGRTVRSFVAERRWEKIRSRLGAGDYLFVQFGHNDMKNGAPAETGYVEGLEAFVSTARAREATPVLVTPPHRRRFDADGAVVDTLGAYPDAVRAVARERDVALVDLHRLSETLYEALGRDGSAAAFVDGTHHTDYGSYQLARCVVRGIRTADLALTDALRDDLGPYDPAEPRPTPATFDVPDVTPDPHLPE